MAGKDPDLALRRALLERHEDLIAAARGLGQLLSARPGEPGDFSELEDAAGRLDEAALGYARARWALGPCRWVLGEVMRPASAQPGDEALSECSAALYEAAEAVADLHDHGGPEAAVTAARTILGQAALRFERVCRAIVAYEVTLHEGD